MGDIQVGVDHSEGPLRNNIYSLAPVDPPGADNQDVNFIRSSDGGNTWSTPLRINTDPADRNAFQWFPMLGVARNASHRCRLVRHASESSAGHFAIILFLLVERRFDLEREQSCNGDFRYSNRLSIGSAKNWRLQPFSVGRRRCSCGLHRHLQRRAGYLLSECLS